MWEIFSEYVHRMVGQSSGFIVEKSDRENIRNSSEAKLEQGHINWPETRPDT